MDSEFQKNTCDLNKAYNDGNADKKQKQIVVAILHTFH